ncbi:MAG: hypothetical protein O3C27_17175 [Actinomycetota bacterium]|nr:hypothetical protein [Actinomycetota bacterium]
MKLKDRLLTRPVAEAMMSPAAILLAGIGAAAGIVSGGGAAAAVAAAAVAWVARVGIAVPRGPVRERIDRRAVSGPWQQFVDDAVAAEARFEQAVERTKPGPIRERMAGFGSRIDEFVRHSYDVARSGQALTEARGGIDIDRITADLHRVTAGRDVAELPEGSMRSAANALLAQLQSAQRLDDTIAGTYDRLLLLDARLDEIVTRSIELSVTGNDAGSLVSVERDLIDVVDEMEALRQAVAETA